MEQQSSSNSHKQEDEDKVNVGDGELLEKYRVEQIFYLRFNFLSLFAVRKNWRMFEDFGVAYTMQQDECMFYFFSTSLFW